ncbi:UNVERIFIED_CONTAM: hypothetical protein Sindi_1107000 [Sesamum indicum]
MFAEVVAPSKAPQIASQKFFLADLPPPSIGAVLTDEKGPTLIFSDAETEALAAPFRLALVGKFSHGKPQFRHLHRLIAGLGVRGAFTVSMLNAKHVLICLSNDSDFSYLWLRRIWHIQGFPMHIFKWTPSFTPAQESSIIPVWVRFPKLPAHLFHKNALFAVANMIGTPLQIDDCTLNQSKLSHARIGIEIDLTKPLVEGFNLQINGVTIHQKVEYEQLPKYCNLCKHVGHDDLECYTMGNAPRPPPRAKKSKGKETMGTEEQVVTEKVKTFERGECSKMGEENSENKMAEGNWIQVGNATMLLQEDSDKGETLVIDATPLKICDPPCFTNCNPADSIEQLLLELASPDKLPRNDFIIERLPEYLVKNTELKFRCVRFNTLILPPPTTTKRPLVQPHHHLQQTAHLLLHRGVTAAPPPAGRRKIPPASEATRAPPLDAPLKTRHNHGGVALKGHRTPPYAPVEVAEIAPKSPPIRRRLLSKNSAVSRRVTGRVIYHFDRLDELYNSPQTILGFMHARRWAKSSTADHFRRRFAAFTATHGCGPPRLESSRGVDWDRFRQVSSPVCRVLANLPFARSPSVAPPLRRRPPSVRWRSHTIAVASSWRSFPSAQKSASELRQQPLLRQPSSLSLL